MSGSQQLFRGWPGLFQAIATVIIVWTLACTSPNPIRLDHLKLPATPPLETLDVTVAEQYRRAMLTVETLTSSTDPAPVEVGRAFGRLGMWYQAYTFFDGALVCYETARTLDPLEPRWAYYRGHAFLARGMHDQARHEFLDVLAKVDDDVPTLVQLGEIEEEMGDNERALRHLERALELRPRCARAMVGLARMASSSGDLDQAEEWLMLALENQPRASSTRYMLAQVQRRRGDIPGARRQLMMIDTGDSEGVGPTFDDPWFDDLRAIQAGAPAHLRLGRAALKVGKHHQAVKHFQAALESDPDHVATLHDLATALLELGQNERAVSHLERALSLDPRAIRARLTLGAILAREQHYCEAEEHFRSALEIDPGSQLAWRNLIQLHRVQGQLLAAVKPARRLCELDPTSTTNRFNLAALLTQTGRHQEAISLLVASLAELGDDPPLTLLLSRLLAASPLGSSRDGTRALTLANAVFAVDPCLAAAQTVAMAHAELGSFDEARTWQKVCMATIDRVRLPRQWTIVNKRFEAYVAGQPWRQPWHQHEGLFGIPVQAPRPTSVQSQG